MTGPCRRLEEHMDPGGRAMLTRLLSICGVEPSAPWWRIEWLNLVAELLAVDALALRLQDHGMSHSRAIAEACAALGVSLDTHRARVRRARRDALL